MAAKDEAANAYSVLGPVEEVQAPEHSDHQRLAPVADNVIEERSSESTLGIEYPAHKLLHLPTEDRWLQGRTAAMRPPHHERWLRRRIR